MATLEDILAEFGATDDFWATAGDAEKHAERDEAWDEVKSLVRSLPEAEAKAVLVRIVDEDSHNKPTYLTLAEIYTERGDAVAAAKAYEKAAEAASKAQEALLRDYSDPADLCWLGYLLLQRCDADELPLCAHHFSGSVMEFGDDSRLVVSQHPFSDATVEGFSNEPETLRLATRAFGLAWLYYYKHSEKKSDAWHALPALDGLRAVLFHADNFEALQVVSDTFWDWVEGWGFGTVLMCAEFVANFRETAGYLQGRRLEAAVQEAVQITRRTAVVSDPDVFAETVANNVAARLSPPFEAVKVEIESRMQAQLGDVWTALPRASSAMLLQAEYSRPYAESEATRVGVVLLYANVVEAFIRHRLRADRIMLGEVVHSLDDGRLNVRRDCQGEGLLEGLRKINALRRRAGHGDPRKWRPPSSEELLEVHHLVIGEASVLGLISNCLPG